EVVGHIATRAEHRRRDLEIPARLRCDSGAVLRRGLINAFVLDAVLLLELLAQLPEELVVHGVRRAMRRVVVLEVAAALAGAEPPDARDLLRILTARSLEDDLRHVVPLAAPVGAD